MYEKTISKKTAYEGIILNVDVLDVELETGRRSVREIVQHGLAVALIARAPNGNFVFIRQFRKPIERICFEVVAGNCDHGEDPKVSAERELVEETGYAVQTLEKLGSIFPSVGYCTERIDIFFAELGKQGEPSLDDDERIEVVTVSEDEMNRKIRDGEIEDSKTLAAWMLYLAKKAEL
jgi:ADP-ribose pyrophosphatase